MKKAIVTVIINLFIISLFGCNNMENRNKTLEGKWRVTDWTYINYSIDKEDISRTNKKYENLILDFSTEGIFKTNKPTIFKDFQNTNYESYGYKVIINNYLMFLVEKNGKFFISIMKNLVLEIEKIEDYDDSKFLILAKHMDKNYAEKVLKQPEKTFEKVYDYNHKALDKYPNLDGLEYENCYDCIRNILREDICSFIDYSKLKKDITYFIDFIVDTNQKITNVQIKYVDNIKNSSNNHYKNVEYVVKDTYTDTEKDLISGLMLYDKKIICGKINDRKVNTRFEIELRFSGN